MRVLITGATGLVGTELAHALFREGWDISIVSRDAKKAQRSFAIPVQAFSWSSLDEPFPLDALDGVDGVVHLMGENIAASRWTDAQKKKLLDSRVVSTQKISEALKKKQKTLSFFIGTSASGFYGDRGAEVLNEASSPGTGFLPEICKAWETEEAKVPSERHVIFRFGVVLSRQGGMLAKLLPLFRKGLGGPVGSGDQYIPWIHLQDLTALLVSAATDKKWSGIWNAATAQPVTNHDFGKALAGVLEKPFALPAPAFALKLAMGEMASVALDSARVAGSPKVVQSFKFQTIESALQDLVSVYRDGHELLERDQWVPQSLDKVFPFFSSEKNLEQITPEWLGFKVLKMSTDQIQEGSLIDYKLRIKGVPARWRTRIEEWEPPHRFVDTQLKGPYHTWHHTHTFESVRGGTWLRDKVRYKLPMGALGRLLMSHQIRKDVTTIFNFRNQIVDKRFGAKA